MGEPLQTNDLFDGTFTIDLPTSFQNIRDKSYVPDNQEVFTDVLGDGHFMLEVTEPPEIADSEAMRYYFDDLAECNEAEETNISVSISLPTEQMPLIEYPSCSNRRPTTVKCYLEGAQKVIPGKQQLVPAETVQIFMALVRLKQVESDVLLSLNVPHKGESVDDYMAKVEKYRTVFKRALQSFKILSLDVFAHPMVI